MVDIHRVVSAVDFSESSRRALDYAIGVAKWYRAGWGGRAAGEA